MAFKQRNDAHTRVVEIIQDVPKNPQTIENNLLLEFQCLALS